MVKNTIAFLTMSKIKEGVVVKRNQESVFGLRNRKKNFKSPYKR